MRLDEITGGTVDETFKGMPGGISPLKLRDIGKQGWNLLAEDMPLHTTVIGQDEIKLSTAQTLDQLLRTVPGFDFTGVPAAISDPTGQQTKMRGLGNAKRSSWFIHQYKLGSPVGGSADGHALPLPAREIAESGFG